jgi:lipoprotein-anchoring transpeptidase ErfK/SrfK
MRATITVTTVRITAAAFTIAIAALAGCGSGSSPESAESADQASTSSTTAEPGADAPAEAATEEGPARVARPDGDVEVFAAPGDSQPTTTLPATTGFGSARALLVVDENDQQDGWLEVALPTRPNGSTGWIRADGVAIEEVQYELVVDVAARTLTLLDGGETVLRADAAVGRPDLPTPTGEFYLTDKLATGDDGAYGPFALGLSAHSEVLTEFAGGDGQVGIHGTNDPSSIGQPVSHGCVRVANDVITRLADLLPLGTPVTVV